MSDTILEESDVFYHDVLVGTMRRYTDRIYAEIWAFEERMRIRLELLGFVEDDTEPNTYWLQQKEPPND